MMILEPLNENEADIYHINTLRFSIHLPYSLLTATIFWLILIERAHENEPRPSLCLVVYGSIKNHKNTI